MIPTGSDAMAVDPVDQWVIEPRAEGAAARARDVWRYRRLLRYFALRSFQKLYMRTKLGWAWLFIRPLFPLLVNRVIFGGVLAVKADGGIPYLLFLVAGTTSWELFNSAVMWGTRSLEINRGLLSRIYIPRVILPIAAGAPAFLNFSIYVGVLLVTAIYYRWSTGIWYLHLDGIGWALQAIALGWLLALGIAMWTSVPALMARDVRFTLNYVLGFGALLTPIMYPLSAVPEKYRWVVALNPMTSVVQSFKFGVLGIGVVDVGHVFTAWGFMFVVLVTGLMFFSHAERASADKS